MKKVRNRSRKKTPQPQQDGFLFVGPAALILLIVAGVCLGYLTLYHRCDIMGSEIQAMEGKLQRLKDESNYQQGEWSRLNTLSQVKAAVTRHGLNMTKPDSTRTVRIQNRRVRHLAQVNPTSAVWAQGYVHD